MPDPFDILGLPPSFDLEPGVLERAYLARAAKAHPDAARDDPEAARRSALLNEARRVLADPEQRAGALLARLGGPAKEQEKSLPPGFLAGMMQTREDIEEALASDDRRARATWESWAAQRRDEHLRRVARMFHEAGPSPIPEARRAIRVELNAWRYVERLIEQLHAAPEP